MELIAGARLAILIPLFVGAVFLGFFLELVTVEWLNLFARSTIEQSDNDIFETPTSFKDGNKNLTHSAIAIDQTTPGPDWKRPVLFNITHFRWIRNNASLCEPPKGEDKSSILLVFVHSARSHILERRVIRKTWGSLLNRDNWSVRVVFLLGQADRGLDLGEEQEDELNEEQALFGDLVEGNFVDSYRNLTYKHMMGYKWILNFCRNADFVLKVDDDMFLDILQFIRWRTEDITENDKPPDLYCSTAVGTKPQRCVGCKWYTSEIDWEKEFYPDYCAGSCYGVTVNLIDKLYSCIDSANFFWVDDVFATGVLMEELKRKYSEFTPIYKHLWGQMRSLDFRNYRPLCERGDMKMKRKFGVVVPVPRGSNFERDMVCLWNKILYDDNIACQNAKDELTGEESTEK